MKVYQFTKKNTNNPLRDTHYVAGSRKTICKKIAKAIYGNISDLYDSENNFHIDIENLPDYVINADEYSTYSYPGSF